VTNTTWVLKDGWRLEPRPCGIVGIVNVTPDSFYDGGRYCGVQEATSHGMRLAQEGAHMLDVGGESSRPFADPVPVDEELRRVVPVVAALVSSCPQVPVAVDTVKAEVARQALEAGAVAVNDISALEADPALADVLAQFRPGYVLMHAQGTPQTMQVAPHYEDVVGDVLYFFEKKLGQLTRFLPEDRIVLDVGIGFGKTLAHNLALLRAMDRFAALGRPLYVGVSNKSLWHGLLGRAVEERLPATVAATAILCLRGVAYHRVHEVAAAWDAVRVAQTLDSGEVWA